MILDTERDSESPPGKPPTTARIQARLHRILSHHHYPPPRIKNRSWDNLSQLIPQAPQAPHPLLPISPFACKYPILTRNPSPFACKYPILTRNPSLFACKYPSLTRNPSLFAAKNPKTASFRPT